MFSVVCVVLTVNFYLQSLLHTFRGEPFGLLCNKLKTNRKQNEKKKRNRFVSVLIYYYMSCFMGLDGHCVNRLISRAVRLFAFIRKGRKLDRIMCALRNLLEMQSHRAGNK